jgi:tetratricopeptide (TPR) repeat protein
MTMAASDRPRGRGPRKTASPVGCPAGHATSELAKLSRPRLYGALAREHLLERIDALRTHPVVWIAGPPGAGKTTLAASYLEQRGSASIWYQLDAGDADVSTFFFYLSQAARPLSPGQPDLPLFTPEYLPDLPGFARRYFRELFVRMPQDSMLVLDNFQEVPADSPHHQAILAAIGEVPAQRNLMVISRGEPALDYTRGIASGHIAQLRPGELRLSLEETRMLALARDGMTDPAIEALHARSDGWAAGLVLMLERADADAPEAERIGLASREAVFDYFASIFFDHAPPPAQRAMMLCALASTLTAPAAAQISQDYNVPALLDDLFRRQLFVQRLGAAEPVYRFHSLFREFLNARARQVFAPAELRSALLRAARAAEAAADIEQAYALFADSEQWADAVRLVVAQAPRLFAEGRWRTILDWIARLPAERSQEDPWVGYWAGVSQFQFDQELSRSTLAQAFARFEAAGDRMGQMLTAASILAGYYFEYAKWDTAEPWIFRLGHLLESQPAFPSRELEMTVYSAMLYGIAIRRPDHPLLPMCIARTVALIENDLDINARMLAGLAITGPVVCMLGAFDLFYRVRTMLLPLLEQRNLTELNRAAWHMTNGTKLCLHAEYEETYHELEQGARLSAQFNLRQIEVLCQFFIAMHAAGYFDVERTRSAMDALQRVVNPLRPLERAHQQWGEGMYETVAGNFAAAIVHHEAALLAVESIGGAAHRLIGLILYCAPLVLAGRITEGLAAAEEGLRYARECKLHTWDACFVLIQAWCRHEQGEHEKADRLLDKAIEVGEDGTYRYFRWLLQGSRKMLGEALRRGIRTESVKGMVQRFRYAAPDPLLEAWPWPVKIRTLGTFAIEVNGQQLHYGRKTPKRLLSLLQCLIAMGGRDVAEHKLADALWPAADGDEAYRRLTLTLHRLRQLLGDADSIRLAGGKVSLNPERVWVDALCLLQARETRSGVAFHEFAASLYRGEFMQDESGEAWVLPAREHLRALHAQAMRGLAEGVAQSEVNRKARSF